ncbi:MAG TPA: hypothetical protein ENK56_00635 [Chloroflexi bacterium]|nr:hypothetical protein [Chloroflexota bacterium]
MRRTTIWFDPEVDSQALKAIRERWGLDSDSAAWRFAVRVLAQVVRLEVVLPEDFDVEEVKKDV